MRLEQEIKRVQADRKLNPKAIMPVVLFGLAADYDCIRPISEVNNLFIIQDSAQRFGAEINGQKALSMGNIGCTSFSPAKPLGCYGDGGAVFTDDDDLYEKLDSIRVHGKGKDKYDNIRLGLNARLDTLQAAILLEKLKLYPEEIEKRQQVAAWYIKHLVNAVKCPVVPKGYKSVWAQFCVRSEFFEKMQETLKAAGVPSARYYPVPLHLSKAFEALGYARGSMPVSEAVAEDIFALPMHPYLDEATIIMISEAIKICL